VTNPNQVRERCRALHMTQQELADAVNAGRVTIARAESGRQEPSLSLAIRLAEALGCSLDDLFRVTGASL
jgi:DNA-binding XRE family transcriptional regulator